MIQAYTLNDWEQWRNIVCSFKHYDVYYLPNYVKAFEINGDGEPLLLYFETSGIRAFNVVMKRDLADFIPFEDYVAKGHFFDIVTPYGYGGFVIEGNNISALQSAYERYCVDNGIICEFIRFHPLFRNWEGLSALYTVIHVGDTVCLNTENEDIIWANLASKNRNMIRKAQKNELKVFWGRDPKIIDQFISIYNDTMDKDNAKSYYYFPNEFYESILNDLKQNAMWFYVKKNEKIVAIAIFMFCNGVMHYHLSASRKEYQHLAPSNLMIYEAAVWAANHGYNQLHLGGGVGSNYDNLYKFKKAFNRSDDTQFWIGKKIFNKKAYLNFIDLREKIDFKFDNNTSYFPAYRG